MRIFPTFVLAAGLLGATCLSVQAAPNTTLCDSIGRSFAAILDGSVIKHPIGQKMCMVSIGQFATMSVSVNVSLMSGSASTLRSMRSMLTTPAASEPTLGDGAYSILNAGGGGMLPQFTMNAAKSGKWVIIEIRRKAGFDAATLSKARAGAKAFLNTL